MAQLTPKQLGKRIKELRKAANLTQDELADRADVSYSSIAKLEQGKTENPSFFTILRLSELLSATPDQLVGLSQKIVSRAPGELAAGIQTVVFDIHGVLLCDWQHVYVDLAQRTNSDPHLVEEVFWRYDHLVAEGTMSINDYERALAADLQANPNDVQYPEVYKTAVHAFQPAHKLLYDVRQQYSVAIMSNIFPGLSDFLFTEHILPGTINDYREVILSCDVHASKPFPAMYQIAEQRLGTPESLLFIDDTPANIDTAKRRGWSGVVYDQDNWQKSHVQIKQLLNL